MHLLPENVLVSGDENIPGLAASPAGKCHRELGLGSKELTMHLPKIANEPLVHESPGKVIDKWV